MSPTAKESCLPSKRLASLFDRTVLGFELVGPASMFDLHPLEEACVEHAKEKRLTEFSSGRACAHRALAEFGHGDFPILMGERRAPIWPDSVVGSITHADGYCGAVAASSGTYRGIGVDAERLNRLKPEAQRLICTPAESRWLDALGADARALSATILFSAKEAFYKCQFALTRSWLGFLEVELTLLDSTFEIELIEPGKLPELDCTRFSGRFLVEDSHVFTGIAIEPD